MIEIERKFVVKNYINWKNIKHQKIIIRQDYLSSPEGTSERIRAMKYEDDGREVFYRTKKTHLSLGTCQEDEVEISREAYLDSQQKTDPKSRTITKIRRLFDVDQGGRLLEFSVDTFITPMSADDLSMRGDTLQLMEVELDDIDAPVILPPFDVVEVTGDSRYSNASIAKLP